MRFYLGTHQPAWLGRTDVPLCVSHSVLRARKTFPRALGPWMLDSGGFTQLQKHGRWTFTPAEYAAAATRYQTEVGRLEWAAPMDWMCEPAVIHGGTWNGLTFAGTFLSVEQHQRNTVANLLELRDLAPHIPFAPVLQGWTLDDYLTCMDLYTAAGVDLTAEPVVGVGSVCRREATAEIGRIVGTLHEAGVRVHGFGVKLAGLRRYGWALHSADSMAWSFGARAGNGVRLPGCTHKKCANCLRYALLWRDRVARIRSYEQMTMEVPA